MSDLLQSIKQRATTKVLSSEPWAPSMADVDRDVLIGQLLNLAGSAPYHYESSAKYRATMESGLPFRYYIADAPRCRKGVDYAANQGVEAGKIGQMLNTAELLLMVTWLPDVFGESILDREPIAFTGNLRNMEHLAATGASIQNVLVGATALGYPTYWSSGGVLRFEPMRSHFGIPQEEIILGGLFIFPKDALERADNVVHGKLRDKGKDPASWSKRV